MNIARMEKFEQLWSARHDLPAESLAKYRFESREGYRLPELAAHYRTYCEALDSISGELSELRKDKDRLDSIESNFWDIRHGSHPIADTGDSSSFLEIIGHWMDKPFERVIGEDYNENLRAAIDQAMKAPAYPPARPEYEFDEA